MNHSSGSHCAVRGCTYNRRKLNEILERPCYQHFPSKRSVCGCEAPYKLHYMPADPDIKKQWLAALQLKYPPKQVFVCSFHFRDKKPTIENPFPQLFLGYEKMGTSHQDQVLVHSSQRESTRKRKSSSSISKDVPEKLQNFIDMSTDEMTHTEGAACSEQPQIQTKIKTELPSTTETSQLGKEIDEMNESDEDPDIKLETNDSDCSEQSETERHTNHYSTAEALQLKDEIQDGNYSNEDIDIKVETDDFDSYEQPLIQTERQAENWDTTEALQFKEETEEVDESSKDHDMTVAMHEQLFPEAVVIASSSMDASTQWIDLTLLDRKHHNLRAALYRGSASSQTETADCRSISVQNDGFINVFERIIANEKDSRFYTGLTKVAFLALIKSVEQYACPSFQMRVCDQILMTLMKIKLNLLMYDISKRFGVSQCLVSSILSFWFDTLAEHLKHLIVWLPRETVAAAVPGTFRARYPKTTCIIGCSKIQTETGANMGYCEKTNTNYKPNNTRKYLVAIAPSGPVMFVSCAYGGEVSDSFITRDCGILNNFIQGEEVIADCEFTVGDLLSEQSISLNMPAFIKGINVKHATRRMKMFKVLSDKVPLAMVPKMSKILQICGALVNMLPQISKDNSD